MKISRKYRIHLKFDFLKITFTCNLTRIMNNLTRKILKFDLQRFKKEKKRRPVHHPILYSRAKCIGVENRAGKIEIGR